MLNRLASPLLIIALGFSPALYANDPTDTDDAIVTSGKGGALFAASSASDKGEIKNAEFENFNARYNRQWKSVVNARTGKLKLLHGFVSKNYGNNPETVARSFLKDTHSLFGIRDDLSDLRLQKLDRTATRNHARFQQMVGGVPVDGAELLVHSNPDGQVTMVQNSYVTDITVTNNDSIQQDAAVQLARNDLVTAGVGGLGVSAAVKRISLVQGEYRYVWQITTATRYPMGYWVYRVDAGTGAILYKADEIDSVKAGKGRAYRTNAEWLANKVSNVSLRDMFTMEDAALNPGWLWGLHADIYDDKDNDPFSDTLLFNYDPVLQKDAFDAVHTYYQINTIWAWWDKTVFSKYSLSPPDYFYQYSIQTLVNVAALCNAFYTADVDGNNNPGFVFGDQDSCAPGAEDLAIDNDVFRHEFAHAIMDWSGPGFVEQYGGPADNYGRAMGEGNADWYAFLYSKDPYIGEVAWALSADGYLRALNNTRSYPANVDEPNLGVPEEHYTGEIWGGYLYDVSRALKTKAIPYIYQSSYYFSAAGGFYDGIPDFQDALLAQITAEQDLTGKLTSSAKVWGAMASRGINAALRAPYSHASDYFGTGVAGTDDPAYIYFSFPAVSSISTTGNMLLSGATHEYIVDVTSPGLTLTATVTGKSTGLTAPTLALYAINGTPITSVGPGATTSAALTYANLPVGQYVITVSGITNVPAMGYYKFKVAVK